jgi:hypothetical protein
MHAILSPHPAALVHIWGDWPLKDADLDQATGARLESLKAEHRDLDYAIATMAEQPVLDQVQVQRMKKRKLRLKDLIDQIEGGNRPHIIA